MRFLIASVLVLAVAGGVSQAASQQDAHGPDTDAKACRRLVMIPNVEETVDSNILLGVHLQFPSKVKTLQLSSGPHLWEGQHEDNSVWVRPKEDNATVDKVKLTVFLEDGRNYDFTVRQVAQVKGASCVVITDPPPSHDALADRKAQEVAAQDAATIQALNNRLRDQETRQRQIIDQLRSQIEQQAQDRIKSFQYAINTKYRWDVTNGSEDTRHLIDSVYDDGRFTYIRISTTAFGLPSITGKLNGNDAIIRKQYDDLTGVYTITGLFDQLQVSLGSYAVLIQRQG